LGLEAVLVLVVLAALFVLLAISSFPVDGLLVSALTLLIIVPFPSPSGWKMGVLTVPEAFSGFSNIGVLTVGALFVVVAGLRETGGIDWVVQRVLGRPTSVRSALARITLPATAFSAFLNNTAVVAMLIPAVSDWSRKIRIPPSKLMIPMNIATILGGTCTLIGTSTNLVVAGLVLSETQLPPLRMFDITWVGFPCAVVGVIFLLVLGPRLLPTRGSVTSGLADSREYVMEMVVPEDSPLIGMSIEEAGLRHLPGAYIVEIQRGGMSLIAVGPEERLNANDRLVLAGVVSSMRDIQRLRGLMPATNQVVKLDSPRYRRQLFEAVVSNTCPLVGKTIRDGRFRNRYNAVILAVARNGERIQSKIGDIVLRPGDTLLIEANPSFMTQQRDSRDFFLVSRIEQSAPRRHDKARLAMGILAAMVVVASLGWVDMLVAAILASCVMILTRCCSSSDARGSIEWPTLIAIGASLGLGQAVAQSGAGAALAATVISATGQDPWWTLAGFYLVVVLVTEMITNNAAVALLFPVAMSTAQNLGVNPLPFLMALMIGGSAGFAIPTGYQTNLMVYGPGGYRFRDYPRIGIPLDVVVGLTAILVIPVFYPF